MNMVAITANSDHRPGSARTDLARHLTTAIATVSNLTTASARTMDALTDALLRDAVEQRVSDIHLEPVEDVLRIRFRIDGELLFASLLPKARGLHLVNHVKAVADINPGPLFQPQEKRLSYRLDDHELDLRLAVIPCLQDETMVIRVLMPEMLEHRLSALGLSERDLARVRQWLESTSGMLLSCGPTGSGKTTTVYSLLRELSQLNRAVFCIEDPIEYEIPGINQVRVDEAHQLGYAEGLKSILRMDPDYIMLGELRDARGAEAALTAANQGTVVLSTMHSRDPIGTVTTLRNWHLPNNEIAVGLNMLIAQRLVRRLCPKCRYEGKPTEEQRRWLKAAGAKAPSRIWQAGTCAQCRGLGYHGRTGIFEVWQLDEADYDAILAGMDEHALRRQVDEKNHGTILDDGLEKARKGTTAVDALRHVPDLLPLHALVQHSQKVGTPRSVANARNNKQKNNAPKQNNRAARSLDRHPIQRGASTPTDSPTGE